ncbi:MAG: CotH kinase family protein [Oscillospiraceae bacterium]
MKKLRRQQMTGTDAEASAQTGETRSRPEIPGGGFGGMSSSSDVKLQYIDDDPESYPNIFDNAKTDVSGKDEKRLIASLKKLSSYEDLEDVLDMDAVLRYFVVHNFVVNGDSYTGSMIHNYYLYEQDGKLSMLPWDYNLAFGGFQGSDAESAVNDPIDDVLSDRPMQAWMFSSEEYTALYHEYYEEFLQSADIDGLIDEAYSLIAPYVEKDPTKFCTYDEFETGVQTLKNFCYLRAQSVTGQLDGSIPSTSEAQKENSESLVDASAITISDMGSMGNTMGGKGGFGGRQNDDADKSDAADTEGFTPPQRPDSSADAGTDFEADTQGGPPRARRTVKMVRLPDKQMGRGAAVQAARRRFCSRPARWSSHWDSGLRFSTSEDKKQDGSGRDRPVFTEFQSLRRGRCPHRLVRKPVF